MESPAQASPPKNVASAGFISRKPKRTMRIETTTATTEKTGEVARPCGERWIRAPPGRERKTCGPSSDCSSMDLARPGLRFQAGRAAAGDPAHFPAEL